MECDDLDVIEEIFLVEVITSCKYDGREDEVEK